jgi:FK506-binding nuclear protein
LEITVREGEEIYFTSTGSYDIFLTGNYVAIDEHDHGDDDEDDEDAMRQMGYTMGSDDDEMDEDMSESEDDELDGLEDPRITEVSDEEEVPKLIKADKKGKNKRPAESEEVTLDELISKAKADAPATNGEQKLSKKQAKKLKNNEGQAVAAAQAPAKKEAAKDESSDKKKVQFAKNLEQGPTGSPKVEAPKKEAVKGPRTVGGVTVDDKKEGKGRPAKKGDRIEMRYIGKLKNGKMFDCKCHPSDPIKYGI